MSALGHLQLENETLSRNFVYMLSLAASLIMNVTFLLKNIIASRIIVKKQHSSSLLFLNLSLKTMLCYIKNIPYKRCLRTHVYTTITRL
jgi:hypothetical protein